MSTLFSEIALNRLHGVAAGCALPAAAVRGCLAAASPPRDLVGALQLALFRATLRRELGDAASEDAAPSDAAAPTRAADVPKKRSMMAYKAAVAEAAREPRALQ